MDIQSQVAARRAELERQRKVEQEQARRVAAAQQAEFRQQRERSLDELAVELSVEADVEIKRQNDRLAFARPNTLGQIDPTGFKRVELKRMLWREAVAEFKPLENLLVIAGLSSGITLMLTDSIQTGGLLVVVAGICAYAFHDNHRKRLIIDYPKLFGEFAAKQSGSTTGGGDDA